MITSTSLYSAPVAASSEADCGIWLCLPTGFPSGCGESKSAFKKRIKKFKPPLPSFLGCMLKQDQVPPQLADSYKPSNMTYQGSYAAKMATGYYIEGTRCNIQRRNGEIVFWHPKGCVATYDYVKVFIDGQQTGETYYY